MPGTLMPQPWWQPLDANGNPLPGALAFFYDSGTSVKRAVYADAALATAHPNPLPLDSAGRAVVYFSPTAYKIVLAPSTDTDPPLAPIKTVDPANSVPSTNIDLDVVATAGEDLFAGMSVYLSDGTGGLTAGRWYRTNANSTYASVEAPVIGMVPGPSNIGTGDTQTVRLHGRVTGLSALTPGLTYYADTTAGALTATAPSRARRIGVADSATSLILAEKREIDVRRAATFNATVGNVGAGEDTLAEYIAPAGELSTNGMCYQATFYGVSTSNVNAKTLRARLLEGATNQIIASAVLTASELGNWTLRVEAKRATATTAVASGTISCGPVSAAGTVFTNTVTAPAIVWANAVTIRVTGDATTTNDIQMLGGTILVVP